MTISLIPWYRCNFAKQILFFNWKMQKKGESKILVSMTGWWGRDIYLSSILVAFPCNSKANVFIPWLTENLSSTIDWFYTQFVWTSILGVKQTKPNTENVHFMLARIIAQSKYKNIMKASKFVTCLKRMYTS